MSTRSAARKNSTRIDVFSVLGRFVVRKPWLVIAAWIAVVAVLAVAFPALTKVVEGRTAQPLPAEDMAAVEQMAKDFGESAQNNLIVVLTDSRGLQPADEDVYRTLATTLRGETNDVTGVQDVLTTPALRPLMVSADNKAFYLAVNLRAPAGSPESSQVYQRITEIAKRSTAGSLLTADVTGQAATVGDLSIVSARDMRMIEIATALLVLVILSVIYRRPVTVLLPLIAIGISVAAAQGAVSALTQIGLGVSALTIALMTAMIVGAGTDYAVFLISRYHEYIRSGMDSDLAVQKALRAIGPVIGASAATVAVTFLGMVFTRLPAFLSVGPALAVSIAVAFVAAVTLLPATLVLAGRRGWVAPRPALTNRLWRRSAVRIVRRPKVHLLVSLAVLIALACCAAFMRPTFDDRLQLPRSAESNVGFAAMEDHFSTSTLSPQYLYVHSPHDLRTSQALADLEQMAQRVSQLPNIAAVRGITRPTGQPLDQTELSSRTGQIGTNLLTSEDFKNAATMFISPDGHSVRYVVETKFDPYSAAAMDQVTSILDTAHGVQPNTSLADASISALGTTATYNTIRSYYNDDLRLIVMVTLLVVFAILILLLRAIVAPLYLIASVVISFLSALGLGVLFFQLVLGNAIYWNVPAMAFIVLVAVGADYNLLLIARIREESGSGIRPGIIRAVRSTGGVITSAGIIFAASMFGLLFGSVSTMVQTGFIIGMGLLIDTFVVRTIAVPALAAMIGRANWWPSKPTATGAEYLDANPGRQMPTQREDRGDRSSVAVNSCSGLPVVP
ncbi:MMPL family transporter [Nocardia sp. NPDC046763]|uniref:MMPL family transporter n=1 Tax=Nocardia sp. NPDC046763 TaxID=3155256 RepID=UPI0033EAB560